MGMTWNLAIMLHYPQMMASMNTMCDCEVKSMNLGGDPSAEGLLLHGGRGTCPHEAYVIYGFSLVYPGFFSRGTLQLKGVPRWCDRFGQYGIKVSFWGSGTL